MRHGMQTDKKHNQIIDMMAICQHTLIFHVDMV